MKFSQRARRLQEKHCQARSYSHTLYPFCWNVKMHHNPSFDEVFAEMAKHHYHGLADALVCVRDKGALEDRWGSEMDNPAYESVYSTIIEDMRTTFVGKNMGDTMRCCSPKTAKRFKYEQGNYLWDIGYEFVGRGGGWLALTGFEGVSLVDNALDEPQEGDADYPQNWYQKLCCAIVETTWMVDHRYDEYLYQAAFQLEQDVQEMRDER